MSVNAACSALSPNADRTQWRRRYCETRARTLALAAPLTPEDQTTQSMPDASPTKWHLGHTSWFFETFLLAEHGEQYEVFDPAFAYLFNSYYEAKGPRQPRPRRGMLSRPSLEAVRAYRAHVDAGMERLIEKADAPTWEKIAGLIELGLNHEEQHQELILMDVKHLFSLNPLAPCYGAMPPVIVREAQTLSWISFEGGVKKIGHDGEGFAFDNEGPRHKVFLEPFKLASRLVVNADYLEFMRDGGYERPEFWLSEGWATIQREGWEAPLYWRRDGAQWRIFTLAGVHPINPAAPVCHVSYFEADAFARWAGKRLPTEAEWETAAGESRFDGEFAASGYLHPRPVRAEGLGQMLGDAWEWTQSPYTAYPGFRPNPGAVGEYNGKFMCNQFVLRGGSAVTPAGHARITYRNFFPPDARWAFSGLRLADDC